MLEVQLSYTFSSDGFSVVNQSLTSEIERETYGFVADNSSYFDENPKTAKGISICKDVKKYILCIKIEEYTIAITLLVDGQSRHDYITIDEFKKTGTLRKQLMTVFKPFQPDHIAFLEGDVLRAEALSLLLEDTVQ